MRTVSIRGHTPIGAAFADSGAEAAPGAALGESAAAVVARVFVPFAEFVAGVSVPFAAAPAASSQRPAVAAAVSDVLDPASAEVSGVPLPAGHRAFAVLACALLSPSA